MAAQDPTNSQRQSHFRRIDLWLLASVIGLCVLVALPVLTYPMGRDQGMYANIARTILNGGLPFIDMWDIKPPAIYYIYAAGIAVFGGGSAAIRAIDFVFVPLTMIAVYWLGLRLTARRTMAVLASVMFAVFYFTETFASLTQSDSLVTLPMALAVVCVIKVSDHARGSRPALVWAVLAGALAAVTIWFKHYYAIFVLALVVEHLIRRRTLPVKEALAFALGGLPVGVLPLLYFVSNGVFDEMLIVAQGTSQYNAQAAQSFDAFVTQMSNYVLFRWWHWGVLIVLAVALVVMWAVSWIIHRVGTGFKPVPTKPVPTVDQNDVGWRIVILWLLAGLAFVLIQAKGFDTHWIPMLPPLVLMSASVLDHLIRWMLRFLLPWDDSGVRGVRGIIYALAIVFLLGILAKDTWIRAFPYLTGAEDQRAYYMNFQGNDFKPWESVRLVEYLEKRTSAGDTLYVFGFRPEVPYLADLRPATRFQANFPLVSDGWYPVDWQQENVDTLWAAMPPYVLVMQADYLPWVTGKDDDSATLLTQYKTLEDWLIFNYERVREIGDFIIWERKDLRNDDGGDNDNETESD